MEDKAGDKKMLHSQPARFKVTECKFVQSGKGFVNKLIFILFDFLIFLFLLEMSRFSRILPTFKFLHYFYLIKCNLSLQNLRKNPKSFP